MNGSKTCSACGETKPLTSFYARRKNRDGYEGQCKACLNPPADDPKRGERSVLPRFWTYANRIDGDACWLWSGEVDAGGYGVMHLPKSVYPKNRMKAHRFSWELHNGPVPEGMSVLHRCDVRYAPLDFTSRRCVNPHHLWLGTHADNMKDMADKGRGGVDVTMRKHPERRAFGESVARSALNSTVVSLIRAKYEGGSSRAELAREYGVNWSCIDHVVKRETWRHVL